MKNLIVLLSIMFSTLSINNANAQNQAALKNEAIQVYGNCGSCKSRIEKAAKAAGAKTAIWESESQTLVVDFDESKTSIEAIEKAVAQKGHDTENFMAADADYNKLPGCCQYERKENNIESSEESK